MHAETLRPSEIPLALYAHFPWCVRKCPYCDFNSHRSPVEIPEARYIDALLEDLRQDMAGVARRPVVSIFLGGGTPSLFSPEAIHRFIAAVRELVELHPQLEITMEANPGTIEHGRFSEYRAAGVNRVSLGVQSFDAEQLKRLGRIHGPGEVHAAVEELHAAGLDNFNIDLMFGLPDQSLQAAVKDVQTAISMKPSHLSHYQLTLEPGTAFFFRPPALPSSDENWDMQIACQDALARAGYQQYEVSAYALERSQCTHNLNYWLFGDYFGLGAGAHGKLSSGEGIIRIERRKQPRDYLERAPAERVTRTAVPASELAFEFMLNALRLRGGFHRQTFETRTGGRWEALHPALGIALQRGLLTQQEERCLPTDLGWRFLNDLQTLFLPERKTGL